MAELAKSLAVRESYLSRLRVVDRYKPEKRARRTQSQVFQRSRCSDVPPKADMLIVDGTPL